MENNTQNKRQTTTKMNDHNSNNRNENKRERK